MIKILVIRSNKAFLPEINEYIKYFKNKGIIVHDSSEVYPYDIKDYDIIWEFKGFGGINSKKHLIIHDYASLSTGKFPKLKNKIKSIINTNVDIRIFLNEDVKNGFNFKREVDYCYRDMGISDYFLNFDFQKCKKEYDFVYIGAISKERNMHKFIENLNGKNYGKVCFIGNVDEDIYAKYKNNRDFIFTGKVNHHDIPDIASQALYGINYIPNKYPYNLQTSTKLLEYLALGLDIISTDYYWINNFEKKYNCKFYKINQDELNLNKLESFKFRNEINMKEFLWDNIIENSGIYEKIMEKI